MAQKSRPPADPHLRSQPLELSRGTFFDVVRHLERIVAKEEPIGAYGHARAEPLRLRPSASLAFPTREVSAIAPREDQKLEVTSTFLGLIGSSSPLPSSYAEHIALIAAERRGERLRAFLDVFHHRLLTLLYRGWERYLCSASADLSPLLRELLGLVGLTFERQGIAGLDPSPSLARVLIHRSRGARGLSIMLARKLGQPVQIVELERRRYRVEPQERSRLGERPRAGEPSGHNVLGSSFLLGSHVIDRSGASIRVRAASPEHLLALAPGGRDHQAIQAVVSTYTRTPVTPRLVVAVDPGQTPPPLIGRTTLARNAWLGGGGPSARQVSFPIFLGE